MDFSNIKNIERRGADPKYLSTFKQRKDRKLGKKKKRKKTSKETPPRVTPDVPKKKKGQPQIN